MDTVQFDYRFFPLVILRWPDRIDEDGLTDFFRQNEAAGARALRERTWYVTVVVATGSVTAAQRKRITQWTRTMPAEIRERVLGSFVVIHGPVQRGILVALKWIAPDLKEVFPVESVEAAVRAGIDKLAERNVVVRATPDEIIRYVAR